MRVDESSLRRAGMLTGLISCGRSLSLWGSGPVVPRRYCLFWLFPDLQLLQNLHPTLTEAPRVLTVRGRIRMSPLWLSTRQTPSLSELSFRAGHGPKECLQWGLSAALIHEHRARQLEGCLSRCPFGRTIVVTSLWGPRSSLDKIPFPPPPQEDTFYVTLFKDFSGSWVLICRQVSLMKLRCRL